MFNFLTGLVYDSVAQMIGAVLYLFGTIVGQAIAWLANMLNYLVHIPVYPTNNSDIAIIRDSWTIFRDISNMFFIIALVIAAFATIFDVFKQFGPYSFSKDFITRFIVSAILINFSFIIGVVIIDLSQIVSNVFLTAIGDVSIRLGQAWNPSSLLPAQGSLSGSAFNAKLSNSIVGLAAMVIFLVVYAGSIFTAVVFSFLRIPILWALLIVSPLAWLAYLLPFSKKYFTKWWDYFIGWNLFLPYFLTILYFSLLVLTKQTEVWPKIANEFASQPPSTLGNISIPFQDIVRYGIVCATLILGTKGAMNLSMFSKAGIGKTVAWGKTNIYGFNQIDAAIKALGARGGEIRKTGLPGRMNWLYGGQASQERREAAWKDRMRVGGADAKDSQLSKDVGTWKEKFKNLDADALHKVMNSEKLPKYQRLAAAELLREMKQLSKDELLNTYKMYGGDKSAAARKFLTEVDFGKLSKEEREAILKDPEIRDMRVRQKLATVMAEKGDIDDSKRLVELAKELYGPNNELGWRDFLSAAKEKNLLVYAKAMAELKLTPQDTIKDAEGKEIKDAEGKSIKVKGPDGSPILLTADQFVAQQASKMNISDLLKQGSSVWKDENFKNALIDRVNDAQRADTRRTTRKGNIILGGGERIIRDLKNRAKEDKDKLAAILEIEKRLVKGDAPPLEDAADEPEPETEEDESGGTPPPSTTVSYKNDPDKTNLIDLRNT